jgi:hypothetical protein
MMMMMIQYINRQGDFSNCHQKLRMNCGDNCLSSSEIRMVVTSMLLVSILGFTVIFPPLFRKDTSPVNNIPLPVTFSCK